MKQRSLRTAAMITAALLVGLAAVPLFAGADAVHSVEAIADDDASQCPLAATAKATSSCAVSSATDKFIAALLGDAEAGTKIAAALAKENETCGASTAKAGNAALSAKLKPVAAAAPSTCSAHAKVAKVTDAEPSACSASKTDVVARTEAVDAKIAKVVADTEIPACCADEATDAKVAKVIATTEIPACCQDKPANTEEAGD